LPEFFPVSVRLVLPCWLAGASLLLFSLRLRQQAAAGSQPAALAGGSRGSDPWWEAPRAPRRPAAGHPHPHMWHRAARPCGYHPFLARSQLQTRVCAALPLLPHFQPRRAMNLMPALREVVKLEEVCAPPTL
jgi:hypothetical protein